MSKESGESSESNGRTSSRSHVEGGDSSVHVMMSYVSAHKEKPQMDHLTAFLQAQKQGFEYDDTGKLDDDDADYLKAENQKRVKEMLQKAQEELQKRKEKCSEEDLENNKEVKNPDNKEDHNANVLEVFHKMVWLQNQNIYAESRRSCRTENSNNNMKWQSLPFKRQDKDEYFSGTKQMKAKGKRKSRCGTVIGMEDQQRPALGTAIKQKYVQSHGKREHMYETSPLPELTCWQKKAGADLFPDVSTETLTVQGPKEIEDKLLKLAIDESLKIDRFRKLSADFTKANLPYLLCLKPNNCEEIVQFPLQEAVEDESWDPPEGIEVGEATPAVSGQIQGILRNRIEYQGKEMGAKKPQFSKQSGDVIQSKPKKGVSRKYKTKARNRVVSDGRESDSSSEESVISSGEIKQPRSENKVDTDDDNNGGDFNNFVEGKCEVGIRGPYGNEVYNSHRKDNRHGNKKQDQIWKSPVTRVHKKMGENTPESCMPEVSDNRAQVQVEWNPTENWDEQQTGPDAHKDRRKIMSETYLPEAGEKRTEVQVDQNQKLAHAEIRKGDQDLLLRLPGPEIACQGYMPEASDSRARVQVDWSMGEIWKVHNDHAPVPLDKGKGIPREAARGQGDRDGRNRSCVSRNLSYSSNEKLMTDKNNEWNESKTLGDIWIDSVSQDGDIGRTKEASSFVREERQGESEKRMIDHFLGKKSEDSGMYMFTEYDSKVQNYLNKIESSTDVNHNSYLQVPAEQFSSCNPVCIQNSPENAPNLSSSCIHDALMHQTHNPHVPSACVTSQVHHASNSFSPPMTCAAGCFHSGNSLPTMAGIGNQPHVQQVPNQALESCCQPLPFPNIQELFEAFAQEQLQQLMSMNRIVQMAVMNSTGYPNINPACLQNPQSDLKSQAQQMNSFPGSAAPINLYGRLPANYSDLLLQSNNTSFNQSLAALSNPLLLRGNQIEAPKNILVQSNASSCNRSGNTMLVPNSDMYSSGTVSPDVSQTIYPNMPTNNAHSMPLNTPAFVSNHGTQAKHPPWISPLGIGPNYMTPQNYQSSQPHQPAVGSMQNMQRVSLDMYSQPPGLRPADEFASSKMVMGKGRGRLRP